jgi:PAS domain S-box-containing protein
MSIILNLLNEQSFLIFPTDLLGWSGLFGWLALIAYVFWRNRELQKPWTRMSVIVFVVLVIAVPITSLFVGVRLPAWNVLPLPEVALEPRGRAIMFFSAIPWVLAAGLFGPFASGILAVGSGFLLAFWDTHSPYTIIEITSLSIILSLFFRQRNRRIFNRLLRHPLLAVIIASVLHPLIFSINTIFFARGPLTGQIDYAFSNSVAASVAVGVPLLIAGLLALVVRYAFPRSWGGQPPWLPGPAERSLVNRSFMKILPIFGLLLVILLAGGWYIAGNAAEQILLGRMASTAQISSEAIPYFLDSGQSLILQIADHIEIESTTPEELEAVLQDQMRVVPYFQQLFVLDAQSNSVGGYPLEDFSSEATVLDELTGIDMALNGVRSQVYVLSPLEDDSSIQLSFIAAIQDESADVLGVLIGRTDFHSNPFARGIISSLESLDSLGGTGFLVDENGLVLYHPDPDRVMNFYPIRETDEAEYYDETAPNGTRQVVYYQPSVGRSWAVVLTLPSRKAQQLALTIATPLIGMVSLLSVVTVVLVGSSLKAITASLSSLAVETDRIASGDLDHALNTEEADEVGHLRRSFEQMRLSLKARLDELNRLLVVSQGVASNLEMENAVRPILEAGLAMEASSARIVLTSAAIPDIGSVSQLPSRFGLGDSSAAFADLDDQIVSLMEHQDRIVLTNPGRTTLLHFDRGKVRPGSLLAISLHHESQYYGALWIAYDEAHVFSHEEVRFLTTLAGQTALAASNNRLFWSAEFGRQRLAAILASTPDAVIVTDQRDCLLLINPVAQNVFGINPDLGEGKPIEEIIDHPELVDLIKTSSGDSDSIEISFSDGIFYLATASTIVAEDVRIGRVCVLQDITQFKELDALKSEFVATVSHDLRSPLTLLRGYATMLDMVGELNKQQDNYVRKIVAGVESMSRLINNLLDLGRIEAEIGLRLEALPVSEIVEEAVDALLMKANQKRIKIQFDSSRLSYPIIEADHAMLHQAFLNLIDNAIKYSPDGKEIWIKAITSGDRAIFSFKDEGIGISPVDKPRLFEKFYRSASRAAKKESGTGLGLAIVKSVAERHGGRVWVDSQLGKGSTFYFEIPLRHDRKKGQK